MLPDPATPVPPTEIGDEVAARDAWRQSQVATHGAIWTRESGTGGDPYLAGLAAYTLAFETSEPEWAKAAIGAFGRALEG